MTASADDRQCTTEAVCIECGARAEGKHCPECGAQARPSRLGFRSIFAATIEHFLSLDLPLLRTFVDLWRFPGRVAGDFVLGRRQRYSNPLKYNLITAAVVLAVIHLISDSAANMATTAAATNASHVDRIVQEASKLAVNWQNAYIQVLYVVTLPLLAWFLRLLLGRRSGRNTMEFYVLCLYVWGQTYLFQAAGNLLAYWFQGTRVSVAFLVISGVMPFVYFPWAVVGFSRSGMIYAAVTSLVALVVFSMLVGTAFFAAALIWVVTHGIA